jgi:hypothetical protein
MNFVAWLYPICLCVCITGSNMMEMNRPLLPIIFHTKKCIEQPPIDNCKKFNIALIWWHDLPLKNELAFLVLLTFLICWFLPGSKKTYFQIWATPTHVTKPSLGGNCSRNEENLRENASWRREYIFPANNPLATVAENVSDSVLSCCHHSIFLMPNETFTLHNF